MFMPGVLVCLWSGLLLVQEVVSHEPLDLQADVVEIGGLKRSLEGTRQFQVKYGDESIELDLVRSDEFLPKTLRVHILDSDEYGNETIDDWTHTTDEGKEVYVDLGKSASLIIDDSNGTPELRGRLGKDLLIQPTPHLLERREDSQYTHLMKHTVQRLKPTKYTQQFDGVDVEKVMNEANLEPSAREKRQQISQIYVPLHIIVNYDYYALMGSNPSATIEYVKTFYAEVNAYFALITQPKVQISIQAIDIYKTHAEARLIEQHRNAADGGLIAGEVLKTFRKWAYNERSRIGDSYAAIMIMTGTKLMCAQLHGANNQDCNNIGGLAYGGAACGPFGSPLPGETFRIGISLDDYAYSGVPAATHEVGHLLGMSHDGSPADYPNAPSSEACSWTTYNIMGQPTFVKSHTKWSDCSIRQLQYWAQSSGKSGCVRNPPASNPYPFSRSKLTVHDIQKQCTIRHGPQASFPSFCQKIETVNDEVCYKLLCYDAATRQCKFGYGAAPGTPCGPSGQVCYQGTCQNQANLGITQKPPGKAPPVTQGPCVDKQVTLGGKSCYDYLKTNLVHCDAPSIISTCCQSRQQLCKSSKPDNPSGCSDTPGVSFSNQNCAQFLSGPPKTYACDWPLVIEHCCASKATYCQGNIVQPPTTQASTNSGCSDTPGVTFGTETCDQYLSGTSKSFACEWPVVKEHCCLSRSRHCGSGVVG